MAMSQGICFVFAYPSTGAVRTFSVANASATSKVIPKEVLRNPDSLKSRFKRIFCFSQDEVAGVPLVCIGPQGLNR